MKKVSPKILPSDSTGRQIATYRAACDSQREVNARFMARLADKSCGHFGSATPLLSHGYGLDGVAVGSVP